MQLCKVLGGMHALLGWGRCVAVLFDEETEMGLFSWFGEGGAEGGISETVFLSNELQDDSTILSLIVDEDSARILSFPVLAHPARATERTTILPTTP